MNLDELQSVQARERQSSDLQHLRSSFYREVGEYIHELTDRRSALVEEVDKPFSSPEVRQLSDDIETAEQTVEAIYERRVGKVVKKASIAAAGMPVDDDGLTEEEEVLFETLVDRIERNRETVLSVLDGEPPTVPDTGGPGTDVAPEDRDAGPDDADATPHEDAGIEPGGVDAADLMGGGGDGGDPRDAPESDGRSTAEPGAPAGDAAPTEVPPDSAPPGERDDDRSDVERADGARDRGHGESRGDESASGARDDESASGARGGEQAPESGGREESPESRDREAATGSPDPKPAGGESGSGTDDVPGIPRTTVRITADVGEVVGADNRDYDLGPEDVVTLPAANADVLVEKDAAERLE